MGGAHTLSRIVAPSGRGQPLNIMSGLALDSGVLEGDTMGSAAGAGVAGAAAAIAAARASSLPPSLAAPSDPCAARDVPELMRDSG